MQFIQTLLKPKNLKAIRLILVTVGIGISLYLTYTKLTFSPIICKFGDCDLVQRSEYANFFGIPIAFLGVFYYLILAVLIWYKDLDIKYTKFIDKALVFWVIWGVIFSTYLTYLEIYVIKAICMWCIFSYIVVLKLLATVVTEKFASAGDTSVVQPSLDKS